MAHGQKPGWTSREIRELFDEIVDELSLLSEGQHDQQMVEITDETDTVIPMTARMEERYTVAHMRYFSETTNDEFAEDLLPRSIG